MEPYVEDSEEVVVKFMWSLNEAIAYHRHFDDGGIHYSSATGRSESDASTSKSSANHSQATDHSLLSVSNVIELEGPLHKNSARI